MVWLLDTNVLSELLRPEPAEVVCRWLDAQDERTVFVSAITQAEMLYGVGLLPAGRRKVWLEAQLQALFDQDFAGRVLPFDGAAATAYARLAVQRRQAGRPISQADAQIAAVALAHSLVMVTRNQKDFEGCGLPLYNPWPDDRRP